jgi:multisubunit Na+/H+ antiporter MnhE subunit
MQTFWTLFQESVITQALVTLALIVTCCVIWITGRLLPPELFQVTVLVVGFWFGSKVGFQQGQNKGEAQ